MSKAAGKADNAADFQTAARICQLLVLSADDKTEEIEGLCALTLGLDQVRLISEAAFLQSAQSDPECLRALQSGLPYRAEQRLLGVIAEAKIIFLATHSQSIKDTVYQRFLDLAVLLAEALRVRRKFDQRQSSLTRLENEIRAQGEIIDHINDSVIVMDLAGFITRWNRGAEKLFGYSEAEAVGQNILFLYAGEDEEEDLPFNNVFADSGREMTVRRRKKSGELFWASITLSVVRDAQGAAEGIVGYLVDITDRLAAQTELHLHARIFEHSTEAIIVTDPDFKMLTVNRAFVDMTGYSAEESLGKSPGVLRPCSFASDLSSELRATLAKTGSWQGELWDWRKDDQIFPAWVSVNAVRSEQGVLTHYFIVMSDLTERKEAEAQIYRLAYYDALTGLPNRDLLYSHIEQALSESHRAQGHGALIFVDINRFKHLNDSFGHDAADVLLREIAQRLQGTLRDEDVVARVGGDEFVIGLFDLASREDAAAVASKISQALAQPFQVKHLEIIVSASIGIAVYPEDGRDAETLLRAADVAQQQAKHHSAAGWLFYANDMNMRSIERLKLETGLRRAIESRQFVLHYQPQIDLMNGQLVGAEALVRWQHPVHGMIPPGQFIPLAEETGLIAPIGEWVIEEACRQIAAWQAEGFDPVKVAVNLSSRQFRPDLPASVKKILDKSGVDACWLELELTESMLMRDAEDVIRMMMGLREIGVSLSLDDFGTGFSSLAYLKRFPIDKLKIDQSFVRGIPHDSKDMAITRSIINLAQYLELKVLAEGVETPEQSSFLQGSGCDQVQGYLFSRPIDAEAFGRWRQERSK